MKVLHLPTATGGNSWGLAQGERALGLDSSVLVSAGNWLEYPADIQLGLENRSRTGKFLGLAQAFLAVRGRYDVFHFNAGMTLLHSPHNGLNQLDLPFYPKRAALFATYNGCDARQKLPTIARTRISACHVEDCYHGLCEFGRYDGLRARAIEKMARYVNHIWAVNPDLLHFLPADKSSFLPYSVSTQNVGWHPAQCNRRRLRIVHAPTNRAVKGSSHILDALHRLEKRLPGSFELKLIEGIPNAEAVRSYAEADLVIDQLLLGWYGGLAVETMAMGKPVIARIASEDLKFLPPDMARGVSEAVIDADPATIEEVLRRCIEDRAFLERHVQAASEYVQRWHDVRYVASITKEAYEAALCAG